MAAKQQEQRIPAVVYARFSSHNQTEQSIEGQLRDAHTYAERNGYLIIKEYADRAISGKTDQRPAFQKMIKDAEKGSLQVILVWKLDRFARNRYDSANYKYRLKRFGVRVVSVMEGVAAGAEGIIVEGLLESMAEYYSVNLAENVRRGQRESVLKGWFPGGSIPFGYLCENHRLVADPKTTALVQEIFRRYADGESPKAIAADLNARGYRTKAKREWRISSLASMLQCPTYTGNFDYAGTPIDCADAIIDEETFRRCQERRAMNRRAPAARAGKERYILQSKCYCGLCGAPMIGESGRSRNGDTYRYYKCAHQKKTSRSCAKTPEKKDWLESYAIRATLNYILSPGQMEYIAKTTVEYYEKENDTSGITELEKTIRRLEGELQKLVDAIIAMPVSAQPMIAQRMEQLSAQKADAEEDLAKLRITAAIRVTEDQVLAWLKTFKDGDVSDPEFMARIVDVFVHSIYVFDDRLIIFYNIHKAQETVNFINPENSLDEVMSPADQTKVGSILSGQTPLQSDKLEHSGSPLYIFVRGLVGLVLGKELAV